LQDIAAAACGSYAFIPDSGFVGTVFVNAMANLLTTMARDVVLELEPLAGAAILHVHVPMVHAKKLAQSILPDSSAASRPRSDPQHIDLWPLQFGQSRDVLLQMSVPPAAGAAALLQATLHYRTRTGNPTEQIVKGCGPSKPTPDDLAKLEKERCRIFFVEGLARAMSLTRLNKMHKMQGRQIPLHDAQRKLEELEAQIAASPGAQTPDIGSILEDLRGQVAEAFSREDWFTKWGVHFLPSLVCAHAAQQCNNFKDPGVQQYGGDLFQNLRDEADDTFLNLPAPTPTVRRTAPAQPTPTPAQPTPAPRASSFSVTNIAPALPRAPAISSAPAATTAGGSEPFGFASYDGPPASMAAYYDPYAG